MFKLEFSPTYSGEGSIVVVNRVSPFRRRWGVDIIACILIASFDGVKKTDLINRCNLSFAQLSKYLGVALRKELVVVEKKGSHLSFRISDKGKAFLESYENLSVLVT